MNVRWFVDLDRKEQQEFTKLLKTYVNDPVLRQLKKVILERIKELKHTQLRDYDKASWPFYQAHKNGQIEELESILSLLGDIK